MRQAPIGAAAWLLFIAAHAGLSAAQRPYKTSVDVVGLSVTVTDKSGAPVADLKSDDFEVREDGSPQTVTYFTQGAEDADVPLHLGLLFDTSESMERDISFSRSAAIKFLGAFPKAMDFTLVDFDTEVRAARFSQTEFPRLVERIRNRQAKGFTALYDALSVSLSGAFEQTGRKILVLYTDGGDTRSSRSWPEAVRILRASDVTVYAIGFMANQRGSSRFVQQSHLREMATLTGGLAFFPAVIKELDTMYSQIASEIRSQYTLGYVPTNTARDGSWRKITVRLVKPSLGRLTLRTREGYFAPSAR